MRHASAGAAVPLAVVGCLAIPVEAKPKRPKPDQPLTVHVFATPSANPKDAKETADSVADVTGALGKRREWFRVVADRAEAEVVLEIKDRSYQGGKAYVLEGRVTVLALTTNAEIIGQGGLNQQQLFSIWRDAANDMASRLQTYCEGLFEDVQRARREGLRPGAVAAMNRGEELARRGNLEEALAAYEEAVRISPRLTRAYFNRGFLLQQNKQNARAGRLRRRAGDRARARRCALQPRSHPSRGPAVRRGGSRLRRGDPSQARRFLCLHPARNHPCDEGRSAGGAA